MIKEQPAEKSHTYTKDKCIKNLCALQTSTDGTGNLS